MSRMTISRLIAWITLLALVGGCGGQTQNVANQTSPKEVQLTEQGGACGSAVGVNAGDTLVVILDSDPSTADLWEVGFYAPQVIAPEKETADQTAYHLDRTSGEQTLRFLAMGEGQATLVLIYHNPLEEDAPDIKTCEVTVEVK